MPKSEPDLGLIWDVTFHFVGEDDWFDHRALVDAVVDAVAQTCWWPEMQVIGRDSKQGTKLGNLAAVKQIVHGDGTGGLTMLARGPARAAMFTDEAEAWFKIDLMGDVLSLGAEARGEPLRRMGGKAITDMIDLVVGLRKRVGKKGGLNRATARPTTPSGFQYPGAGKSANRPLDAIVDVVDPGFKPPPQEDSDDLDFDENKRIAKAKVPREGKRAERDGLVIIQFASDPTDPDAVRAGAAAHDRWLSELIDVEGDEDEREGGEEQIYLRTKKGQPYDINEQTTYFEVEPGAKGDIPATRWKEIVETAKSKKVGLIVATREQALALGEKARAAGLSRVVYRKGDEFWDPSGSGE